MKAAFALLALAVLVPCTLLRAAAPDLSRIASRADLDAVIAAIPDGALKQALADHGQVILAGAVRHPHVKAVVRTIETAPGTFAMINTTPEALKHAADGEIEIFDSLTAVNTGILHGHAHQNRDKKTDPYDAAFIEHLGHVDTLESVSVVVTTLEESSLDPLLRLSRLKALRIEKRGGNGLGDTALAKLQRLEKFPDLRSLSLHYFQVTDAGLEHLAGLKHLESFSLRANVPGHAFENFAGWTKLKSIAFHGNGIDDKGLGFICERFPNLETLNLIHARKLTDASAVHVLKLRKLKGILINGPKITAAWLSGVSRLPLESLNVAQGAVTPPAEAIAAVRSIPTLRRLSIEGNAFSDADVASLAGATQITELSVSGLGLTSGRVPSLRGFSHLKKLRIIEWNTDADPDTEAAVKSLLPATEVTFTR